MMTTSTQALRRHFECAAFVLLWLACEFYFRLTPLQSQFLGIPLIVLFQLLIARRPLSQLWAFDTPTFSVDRRTALVAIALAAAGVGLLWLGRGRHAAGLGQRWELGVMVAVSAIPAAFALCHQRAPALRRGWELAVIAAVFRVGWLVAWAAPGRETMLASDKLLDFLTLWVCEFVVLFVFDEVAFRGALDPHLNGRGAGRIHEIGSAAFGSILWALWHLRAYNPKTGTFIELFTEITPFAFAQIFMGTLLVFIARRTRTLVLPCAVHAFMNAYVLALIR